MARDNRVLKLRARAGGAFLRLPPRLQREALHAIGRYAPWEPEFDQRAPEAGRALVTAPPDFVGVGVQKAGTSWWFNLLAAHPAVYQHRAFHKERHFFTHLHLNGLTDADVAAYHRWFPRPAGRLSGEWTPDYLHQYWTPSMLRRAAPEARLLVLLRDPVERFRSGLDHHRQRGEAVTPAIAGDAFARGLYGMQLERLERSFPREQVLVLLYEACRDDPARHLVRSYTFLGIDPSFVPAAMRERVSATASTTQLPPAMRDHLAEEYAADLARLAMSWPELDLGIWPSAAPNAPARTKR